MMCVRKRSLRRSKVGEKAGILDGKYKKKNIQIFSILFPIINNSKWNLMIWLKT